MKNKTNRIPKYCRECGKLLVGSDRKAFNIFTGKEGPLILKCPSYDKEEQRIWKEAQARDRKNRNKMARRTLIDRILGRRQDFPKMMHLEENNHSIFRKSYP